MAIRMRRGNLADFDPTKQLSGEFGVSIDNSTGNQKVFMAFGNGNVKELMTVEDAEAQIGELVDDAVETAIGDVIDTATEAAETATTAAQTATTQAGTATTKAGEAASSASSASTDATSAAGSAASADDSAEDSEAWAVGQRDGQDVPTTDETYHNNAKYWADQASQAAGGRVTSFNGRSGSVSPQSGDYTAAMVGLGNVDNTSDLDKPISTATQAALNEKADESALTDGSVTKIGTGNVGSATQPIYLNEGVPTAGSGALHLPQLTDGTSLATFIQGLTTVGTYTVRILNAPDSPLGQGNDDFTYLIFYTSGYAKIIATNDRSNGNWDLYVAYWYWIGGIDVWKSIRGIATGTPTNVNSNLSYASGTSTLNKSGNVVTFRLVFTISSTWTPFSANEEVCTLPWAVSGRYASITRYVANGNNQNGVVQHAYIDNKKITVGASPWTELVAGQYVTYYGTYLTND